MTSGSLVGLEIYTNQLLDVVANVGTLVALESGMTDTTIPTVTSRDLIEIRDWRRVTDEASVARSWRASAVYETYTLDDLCWFRAPLVGGVA